MKFIEIPVFLAALISILSIANTANILCLIDVISEKNQICSRTVLKNVALTKTIYGIAHGSHDQLKKAKGRFKVTLVNSDPTINYVQPLPPNVVEVDVLHIEEHKLLPNETNYFLDKMNKFQFISLIDMKYNETIVAAIRSCPEYEFVWNIGYVANIKIKPENLHYAADLSQNDILAHKQMLLFISSAVDMDLVDAVHHGVPIIALPQYAHQQDNAQRVYLLNIGTASSLEFLRRDQLSEMMKSMAVNPIFCNTMKYYQTLFRHEERKPLDTAVWWIEKVLTRPLLFDNLVSDIAKDYNFFILHSWDVLMLGLIFYGLFITFSLLLYFLHINLKMETLIKILRIMGLNMKLKWKWQLTEGESESEPRSELESESESEPELEQELEPELVHYRIHFQIRYPETEPESGVESAVKSGAELGGESEEEPGTESVGESDQESKLGTVSEPDSNLESESEPNPNAQHSEPKPNSALAPSDSETESSSQESKPPGLSKFKLVSDAELELGTSETNSQSERESSTINLWQPKEQECEQSQEWLIQQQRPQCLCQKQGESIYIVDANNRCIPIRQQQRKLGQSCPHCRRECVWCAQEIWQCQEQRLQQDTQLQQHAALYLYDEDTIPPYQNLWPHYQRNQQPKTDDQILPHQSQTEAGDEYSLQLEPKQTSDDDITLQTFPLFQQKPSGQQPRHETRTNTEYSIEQPQLQPRPQQSPQQKQLNNNQKKDSQKEPKLQSQQQPRQPLQSKLYEKLKLQLKVQQLPGQKESNSNQKEEQMKQLHLGSNRFTLLAIDEKKKKKKKKSKKKRGKK